LVSTAYIDSIQEYLNQAYDFWGSGELVQAEQLCQTVLSEHPSQVDALHLMGIIAHATQRSDLAIQYLRQACHSPIAPAQYFANLAEILRQEGQLLEAKIIGKKALTLDTNLPSGLFNFARILQDLKELAESCIYFESAIVADSANTQAYFYLANSYNSLGKLQKAKENWLKAIDKDPNHAQAYSKLAVFYLDSLLYPEAMECSQKALDIDPALAEAYLTIASVESERYNHKTALVWIDALLEFDPRNIDGLNARAKVCGKLEQFDEAFASIQLAFDVMPNNLQTLIAKGEVFEALGNPQEAMECFKKAISLGGPLSNGARIKLAGTLVQEGKNDEGLMLFKQALEKNIRAIGAWRGFADIVKFQTGDANIEKMESLLESEISLNARDTMSIHFTLGKAHLDLNDSQKAFYHLNLANQMKRTTVQFDQEKFAERVQRLVEGFTAEFIEQNASPENSSLSHAPIFVLGMPRSGTTLIEQILSSHPMVKGAGELRYMGQLTDQIEGYPHFPPTFTGTQSQELGEIYLDKIAPMLDGKDYLVDKMPGNFMNAGLIRMVLPHAKIIHSRRNAVDTCLSMYSKHFGGFHPYCYNMTDLGNYYQSYQVLMAHWREVLPASHFLEVDYENVVDDIETQTRRMLDFLGLPWDPICLDFYKNERTVKTASVNQVRKPIYSSSSGRWKKHAEQLQPLIAALGPYGI
jgi:tetratricopeptide (TPR) repeat protein